MHAYIHTYMHTYIPTYIQTYIPTLAMAFWVGVWHISIVYCRSDDDIHAFINAATIIMPHPQVSSIRLVGVWTEGCLGEKWVPVGGGMGRNEHMTGEINAMRVEKRR